MFWPWSKKRNRARDDGSEGEGSERDRRRWPRIKLDARVVIRFPNIEQLVTGPLSDISRGGLFIQTQAVRPVGTRMNIKVEVGQKGLTFEARGEVVRVVDQAASLANGAAVGMGIRFDDLDPAAEAALNQLVKGAAQQAGGGE